MMKIDLDYINSFLLKEEINNLKIGKDSYPDVIINKEHTKLLDKNGMLEMEEMILII